jgi:hypothetical protein
VEWARSRTSQIVEPTRSGCDQLAAPWITFVAISALCLRFGAMRLPDATDGAAAPAIFVDIDRLTRLAAVVRSLATEMSDRNGSLQDELADPDLHDALRHAERDWWNQRRRLRSYLSSTADGLAAGAEAYQQVEQGLADAANPDRAAGGPRAAF